jgi:hypothetical protein
MSNFQHFSLFYEHLNEKPDDNNPYSINGLGKDNVIDLKNKLKGSVESILSQHSPNGIDVVNGAYDTLIRIADVEENLLMSRINKLK